MDRQNADGFFYNLEGRYYIDPAIYQLERDRIFRRAWQPIGAAAALKEAGDYIAVDIAGYQVFAQRGDDGVLRGFENVCPHRGARILPPGDGNCRKLQCPYHGWQFTTKGKLEDTPWFGRPSPFRTDTLELRAIEVAEWRGLLFAALAPDQGLVEQLGALPAEIEAFPMEGFRLAHAQHLAASVNWKAYLDQFNEFYHAPAVHSPDKAVGIADYDVAPLEGMMRMRSPEGRASDRAFYGGTWLWGWPNWTLSFFPGGMKTSRVNPIDAGRCEVHFHFFFDPEATADRREAVILATEAIFAEDLNAAGLVQVNYASGAYRPGPLHPLLERAVAYFQARVRDAIEERQDAAAMLGRLLG